MVRQNLLDIVSIPSITNTNIEKQAEDWIFNFLSEIPYFKEHTDQRGRFSLEGDPLGREIVWGLYLSPESKGRTALLINHHDVVSVEEYGKDAEFAFRGEELTELLKERDLDPLVQEDLDSGNWLFGRGVADMKGGLLIQLDVLNAAILQNLPLNLLYLSVPDEENLSAGMRYSQYLMDTLEKKFDLEYVLGVDGEPYTSNDNGDVIYYDSSAGKVMLNVYIQGVKSHIGEVLTGFNPLMILGKLMEQTERNLDLCDRTEHVVAPPPTWSMARDFKERYDASIPLAAGGLFAQVTVSKSAGEIMEHFHSLCLDLARSEIEAYKKDYLSFYGKERSIAMNVFYYEELLQMALEKEEDSWTRHLDSIKKKHEEELNQGDLSTPEFNFFVIEALLEFLDYTDPCIVLAQSPPYYPFAPDILPVSWKEWIEETGEEIYGRKVSNGHYFMGISDLSYVSTKETLEESQKVSENIPLWGESYSIPFELLCKRSIPVVNIGPWGKDIHKKSERVYLPHIEGEVKAHYLAFFTKIAHSFGGK